jgi:acetyl esterase/lipase
LRFKKQSRSLATVILGNVTQDDPHDVHLERKRFMRSMVLTTVLVLLTGAVSGASDPAVMSTADLLALPQPVPDHQLAYGPGPLQYGELRLPSGAGPHPVAVVIHGGCWLSQFDLGHISSFAAALARAGVATWSVEYRRVGDTGGGWPGTFADVAAAADHLREISDEYSLDLGRVVSVGHSAGGHLALWLAGRHGLGGGDVLRGDAPLRLVGVVALAGVPDLEAFYGSESCNAVIGELLGGPPSEVPDRLRRASPIEMLPLGVAQTLIVGAHDSIVPPASAESYAAVARRAGDRVTVLELADAGHFELVAPESTAWPAVRDAVLETLQISNSP